MKPLSSDATCVPVVTVTVRGPAVANALMVIGTDASVGPLTVTVPTLMPLPKLAVVTPGVKSVNWPLMTTVRLTPWMPAVGLIDAIAGRPGCTVKPPTRLATSVPVVIVTVRLPSAADGSMVTLTVALAVLVTTTELTVIPDPNDAAVTPCAKLVSSPVTATLNVSA